MLKTFLVVLAGTMLSHVAAAQPIKIGLSGQFSGNSLSMGISMRNGARLAVAEINAAGGIMGKQIALIERDDRGQPDAGAQMAQELTSNDPVAATVGFVNTDVALASQRFYEAAEIPVINNVATGTMIARQFQQPTYKTNYVFQIAANDEMQSSRIVEEAMRRGFRAPAVFTDLEGDGTAGREGLKKALEAAGRTPVADETMAAGDTDVAAQLSRIKAANADVILAYGTARDLARIANGMGLIGWKLPVVGNEALSTSLFIDIAGANGEGTSMPQTFIMTGNSEKRLAFISAYRRAYKMVRIPCPDSAAQGYDSVYLLKAAIEQARSTEGPRIREALEDLRTKVEGVVTTYDHPFTSADHEALTPNIPVFGVVRGGFVVVAHEQDIAGNRAVHIKRQQSSP